VGLSSPRGVDAILDGAAVSVAFAGPADEPDGLPFLEVADARRGRRPRYLRVFSLVGVHDHDCGEGDVKLLRGLFVQHGYDPDRHPHVCQLDGVPVDSRDDPERTGSLIRCGKKNLNLPNLSSIIG
jgi:hypothetical protein